MKPLLFMVAMGGLIASLPAYGQEPPPELPMPEAAAEKVAEEARDVADPTAEQIEVAREAAPAANEAELKRRIGQLESRLEELTGELESVRKEHATDVRNLTEMVTANAEAIAAANALIKANSEAIESNVELAKSMQSLVDGNAAVIADTSRKLRDLAIQDGQGGYTLDMLGNMQKPQFQRELQQVTQGKLWIHNAANAERVLYVNGTPWRAIAGWSYVWVPFGRVGVTEIPGATPVQRDGWQYSDRRKQYELVYDFNAPWR